MTQEQNLTEACSVCGSTLEYLDRAVETVCTLCGEAESGHVRCPEGHYLCEACHGRDVEALIRRALFDSKETVPTKLAEELLSLPELPMLGCEHALVAGGALMASLRNRGLGVTQAHVDEVLVRARRQAVGAYCGLTGVCGVVPALGASYSVLVGGQCGKGPETRASMELVSRLAAVTAAEAEPGCCKAFVRTALVATEQYLEEKLGIAATEPIAVDCSDSDRHPHGCRGPLCLYHPEADREAPPISPISQGGSMATSPDGATEIPSTASKAQDGYDEFFDLAYTEGALDRRTKILVALGAGLGAGCAP